MNDINKCFLVSWLSLIVLSLSANLGFALPPSIKSGPVGIIGIIPLKGPKYPLSRLADFACWANPEIKGVLLRLPWGMVEPREGEFDFGLCDQSVALARKYGKSVGLGICAGTSTPEWVYQSGVPKFYFNKNRPGGVTKSMAMPLPWDAAFQTKWASLIKAFGQRYDAVPEVAYILMAGPGRDFETYFVDSPSDIDNFNQTGGGKLWGHAARVIADLYAAAFPHTTLIYAMGPPTPTPEGHATIDQVVAELLKKYPNHFGVCNASLAPRFNPHHSGIVIRENSARTIVGFQMLLPSKDGQLMPGGSLADALRAGVAYKAHCIEVYLVDCDDPTQQQALHEANVGLYSNAREMMKKS